MFIIWNGLGFLVIPVVIVGAVAAGAIGQAFPNDRWLQLLAVLGTAASLLGLGVLLNRPKIVGQDRFGNAIRSTEDHSLYWIPVQYWSAIVLLIGTVVVFKR